jgi:hypothetical protein
MPQASPREPGDQRTPVRQLTWPVVAEGAGFEPAAPYSGAPLFESGTINHSDTLPPRMITHLPGPRNPFDSALLAAPY